MDPIGAIASITGQVLRRIADALDAPAVQPSSLPVHIGTVHVTIHPPADARPARFGRSR